MGTAVPLQKCFNILATTCTITILFVILLQDHDEKKRQLGNWRHLNTSETEKLSVLGRILFLEESPPEILTPKTYKILVWKYGKSIENRHLKNWGRKKIDPFEYCSVKNCNISYKDEDAHNADIILFHMHQMKQNDSLPQRQPNQIWAFLTDESPYHMFQNKNNLSQYNNIFNWSMTYRMDSDIPVPYGRTIARSHWTQQSELTKNRTVLIAVMGSNCGGRNHRWDYVKELQKHITIDVYGKCGTLTCPGHFARDCSKIDSYLFYLAFENSNCDEYITEKLWWNAYQKNAIPIVMGSSKETYRKLLPPNSYINIDDYAKPSDLANYIKYLNSTGKYLDYFQWKSNFEILNEHGYFQSRSYHYCRVCEALNYNHRQHKVYSDLDKWWNVRRDCHPAWNT